MVSLKNVHALTHLTPEQAKPYIKITNNQWSVYYYLLSISDYNAYKREDHRYVYRENLSATKIARKFSFTPRTYYNTLDALHKKGLIDNSNSNYITIPLPRLYTEIPKKLLAQLLAYYDILGIDLLRTYLFFKGIEEKYNNKSFTIRNIIRCLGQSDKKVENYRKVLTCIDLLSCWDLIGYKSFMKEDTTIGKYRLYSIKYVRNKSEILDARDLENGEFINYDGLTEDEEKILQRDLNLDIVEETDD